MNDANHLSPEETQPGKALEDGKDQRADVKKATPSTSNSNSNSNSPNGIDSDHRLGNSEDKIQGSEAMGKAISSMLGSVIRDFDSRAEATAKSQDVLSSSLDRLIGELDKLLEDAPLSFIMQHAAKMSSVRKRISALNLLLKSTERRIDNIDRMLSAGLSQQGLETSSSTTRQHSSRLI